MTQERLPHALDGEHGKLAPCMERALKLTRVLPKTHKGTPCLLSGEPGQKPFSDGQENLCK